MTVLFNVLKFDSERGGMKRVIVKEDICKVVVVGQKDVLKFETEDGVLYTDLNTAKRHNQKIAYEKALSKIATIKTELDVPIYANAWHCPSNEDELEIIKRKFGFFDKYDTVTVYGELKAGEWMTYEYNDGGDSSGSCDIYTLGYVKNEMKEFLNNFEPD